VIVLFPPGLAPAVNEPEVDPIVATGVLLLLHVPPVITSVNVVVVPGQMLNVPVIADGTGLTVTIVVARHPVPGL
jgi:hypothetical protein